jgi:hypothetical protein
MYSKCSDMVDAVKSPPGPASRAGFRAGAALIAIAAFSGCSAGARMPGAAPAGVPELRAKASSVPVIGGCQIFPANSPWNADVSNYPVDPRSDAYIASMQGSTTNLHADFGQNPAWGFPINVVPATQKFVPVTFKASYVPESNPGPYPIPPDAKIEGGRASTGDRHVLVLQQGACKLFEMFHAYPLDGGARWKAIAGATFSLNTNKLRPNGWTSADAAGLPLTPCMIRYEEVAAGSIDHAMCYTAALTQRGFINPATHFSSIYTNRNYLPMGLRLRLKSSFDLSRYHGQALVVLQAMKKYGMFLDEVGSNFFVQGSYDPRWSDADLDQLKTVPGTALEAVKTGPILHDDP